VTKARRTELPHYKLVVGELYYVTFHDCCVNGRFMARLIELGADMFGDPVTKWSNGLELNGERIKFFVPREDDVDEYLTLATKELSHERPDQKS
jgi:hypothetical protein